MTQSLKSVESQHEAALLRNEEKLLAKSARCWQCGQVCAPVRFANLTGTVGRN